MKKTITTKELLQLLLITILISSLLVSLFYLVNFYNKSKYSYFYYKQEAEKLQHENDSLLKKVNDNKVMIQKYQHNIDSIVELKKK